MKKFLTRAIWILALWGLTYAIVSPDIMYFPTISSLDPLLHYIMVQNGAVQNKVTVNDLALSMTWPLNLSQYLTGGSLVWIVGGVTYIGAWDPNSGNYPFPTNTGDLYIANVTGTYDGITRNIWDQLISNGLIVWPSISGQWTIIQWTSPEVDPVFSANSGAYYNLNPAGYITGWRSGLIRERSGNILRPKLNPLAARLQIWAASVAGGNAAVAIWDNVQANGVASVAMWHSTVADWDYSFAMWDSAQTAWSYSMAIWHQSSAQGDNTFAGWYQTNIIWWNNWFAFGYQNLLSWFWSVALWVRNRVLFNNTFSFNSDGWATFVAQKSWTFLVNAVNGMWVNTSNPLATFHVAWTWFFDGRLAVWYTGTTQYQLHVKAPSPNKGIYSESVSYPWYFVQTGWSLWIGIMSQSATPYYSYINNSNEANSYNRYGVSQTHIGYSMIHYVGSKIPFAIGKNGMYQSTSMSWGFMITSWDKTTDWVPGSWRMVVSWGNLSFQVATTSWNRVEKYSIAP